MTAVDVVIMAAGKGTRMKSSVPKVLHRLGGRPLAVHALDRAAGLGARSVVVVTGHGAQQVEDELSRQAPVGVTPRFVRQEPQLGTGHAVQQAVPLLPDDGVALILNGDVPLIETNTLKNLVDACGGTRLALLTVEMPDPTGYGRIRHRRAQGRDRQPAKDPRNLFRFHGRAQPAAQALAGPAGQ